MKKILTISIILTITFLYTFSVLSFADTLDTLNVEVDKSIVNPGDTVNININFGQSLGSYTFDIAYDSKLLEYVSSEGGTVNDTKEKVRIYFFDATGGTSPRSNMTMKFKAKEGITTSNPTNFSITAEGLASPDAKTKYDEIKTPIVKNITVEPVYEDYSISLEYSGNIQKNEEKQMQIITSSTMGRYYEHARLVASVQTPEGATAKLLATDEQGLSHDILQSGWGDASGYKIGGQVNQKLQATGIFSEDGLYTITLKLIDRDTSDTEIAKAIYNITVGEKNVVNKDEEETQNQNQTQTQTQTTTQTKQEEPKSLPKTGNNILWISIIVLFTITALFIINNKRKVK